METASFVSRVEFQPRVVSGWALRPLCELDAASPHFLGHVLHASPLKRQAVFAAVAELERDPRTMASALGCASDIECRDPLAQVARALVLLKPHDVIRAVYGVAPDGLLGTLKRVGADPFGRPGLYGDLFRLFEQPDERERADLLRQARGNLNENRLEVALALDPALLHQRAFEHVTDLDGADQVNAAVRLIRATVSTATLAELRRSVAVLPQNVELSAWAASWLRKLDRPLAEPPIQSDADLTVLTVADLRAASMQLRNCLRGRILHVASGRDCYVVATASPGAVAELRRTSDGRWVLFDIWGPGNEPPDQQIVAAMRGKLEAAGVASLETAVNEADLEPLAEFFSAFDLTTGWPPGRRMRQRLRAMEEAA